VSAVTCCQINMPCCCTTTVYCGTVQMAALHACKALQELAGFGPPWSMLACLLACYSAAAAAQRAASGVRPRCHIGMLQQCTS
jgi:hypothetical protein